MKKLIDKLGLGDSAKDTSASPSPLSAGDATVATAEGEKLSALQPLLDALKAGVEKTPEIQGNGHEERAKLAALVLGGGVFVESPEDSKAAGEPILTVDKKAAKQWAFALGQTLGLLAGIAIPGNRIESALMEICREGQRIGEAIDTLVTEDAVFTSLMRKAKPADPNAPPDPEKLAAQAKAEANKRLVQDLTDQADLEQDPAGKAALVAMAARLKREMELDQ